MTKTWCAGGRHFSQSVNQIIFEKLHPETNKDVKIIKSKCTICYRNKSQIFTK